MSESIGSQRVAPTPNANSRRDWRLGAVLVRTAVRRGPLAALRLLRERRFVLASRAFDTAYYRRSYPDVVAAKMDAVTHYLLYGAAEGRRPNELFDPAWYVEKYSDVARSGLNPLVHYLQFGAAEGRDPGPDFSTAAYLASNPDVARAGVNPLVHYLRFGRAEARALPVPTDQTPRVPDPQSTERATPTPDASAQTSPTASAAAAPAVPAVDAPAADGIVNAVNYVAVFGRPNSGKSTVARALGHLDGFLALESDDIFAFKIAPSLPNKKDFWTYEHRPQGEFDIGRYIESDAYDHDAFIAALRAELSSRLAAKPKTRICVLEGYVFKDHAQILKDLGLAPERTLALQASASDGGYRVGDVDVSSGNYDALVDYIGQAFRLKCLKVTLPRATYQDFLSLGLEGARADSDTAAKYSASHLQQVIRRGDRVVDVGCNSGYFCFRAAGDGSEVVGVDTELRWLQIASHLNNSIFWFPNVTFVRADAVAFLKENAAAFSIIHCASTYHYFREDQVEFLRAARNALLRDGLLVLEVELADIGPGPEIAKRSRSVDASPTYFPNREMFLQQIGQLFTVEAEYPSTFQRGSLYERSYFHLRRV